MTGQSVYGASAGTSITRKHCEMSFWVLLFRSFWYHDWFPVLNSWSFLEGFFPSHVSIVYVAERKDHHWSFVELRQTNRQASKGNYQPQLASSIWSIFWTILIKKKKKKGNLTHKQHRKTQLMWFENTQVNRFIGLICDETNVNILVLSLETCDIQNVVKS